jgi:hypothetical protein
MSKKVIELTEDDISELVFILKEQINECKDEEVTENYQKLIDKLTGGK